MRRDIKAFLSFPFGVLWFVIVIVGIVALMIPQLVINAYGKEVDPISAWIDGMEGFFKLFKEL